MRRIFNALHLAVAAILCRIAPAANDFIPAADSDFDLWQDNFTTKVVAAPATYGLTTAYANSLQTYSTSWGTAYTAAVTPSTRTSVTIATKDSTKATLKAFIRVGARIVQATPSVSNADKTALGLPIQSITPSPVPVPSTNPTLELSNVGPHRHRIRYADQSTPLSSRKPNGVSQMILHYKVSATPITAVADLTHCLPVTRTPMEIEFDSADVGKQVYYAGNWTNRKGQEGPMSSIYNLTVAA
jgi:hypothetical protein